MHSRVVAVFDGKSDRARALLRFRDGADGRRRASAISHSWITPRKPFSDAIGTRPQASARRARPPTSRRRSRSCSTTSGRRSRWCRRPTPTPGRRTSPSRPGRRASTRSPPARATRARVLVVPERLLREAPGLGASRSEGFRQENFLGMNATDYGGGTPVVDVWRRDVGLAVGPPRAHAEERFSSGVPADERPCGDSRRESGRSRGRSRPESGSRR